MILQLEQETSASWTSSADEKQWQRRLSVRSDRPDASAPPTPQELVPVPVQFVPGIRRAPARVTSAVKEGFDKAISVVASIAGLWLVGREFHRGIKLQTCGIPLQLAIEMGFVGVFEQLTS